ncbi:uncharacterized protein FIESC28_00301 [Fusarium coffeatum]|uniref:Uncharacterized protein n=1 Tax=Fusarium coffeatum TaxID=231269 RepID=A0A366SE01_9HYPO|nr:uncharacterized protein FIESC28_00301 [Fusarium coffeatum]RBR26875.1 hypothetical protein FIESC28_00301 [Fusarium coffeatum]
MQIFNLYSTDPVKFGSPILGFPTDKIEFYYDLVDESGDLSLPVAARADLRMNTACELDQFTQPRYFSTGFEIYKDSLRGVEAQIHFIDDNHLILKVSRDLVYVGEEIPKDASFTFTYYGIRDKSETEQKAKQKEEKKKARGRSTTQEQPVRRLSIASTCSRDMEYYM